MKKKDGTRILPDNLLTSLQNKDIENRIKYVGTVAAACSILSTEKTVNRVATALFLNMITEDDVDNFLRTLFMDFEPGKLFRHWAAVSALLVALKCSELYQLAEKIAKLNIAEFTFLSSVARWCLNSQEK